MPENYFKFPDNYNLLHKLIKFCMKWNKFC